MDYLYLEKVVLRLVLHVLEIVSKTDELNPFHWEKALAYTCYKNIVNKHYCSV